MVSQIQRGRCRGTVVARGSTNDVNVRRMMTSPPRSRFARVASMPNGATVHPVAIPVTIMSTCASSDIDT